MPTVINAVMDALAADRVLEFLLIVMATVAATSTAAWLASRLLAGKAALQHLVLLAGLGGCLAAPLLITIGDAMNLTIVSLPLLANAQRSETAIHAAETHQPATPSSPTNEPQPSPVGSPSPSTTPPANESRTAGAGSPAMPPAVMSPSPTSAVQPHVHAAATRRTVQDVAAAAALLWAIGAILMLARLARNCTRVILLRCSSPPLQNAHASTLLNEVAAKLGARRTPLLLAASRTIAPLAVGFGRPAIILPQQILTSITNDELRDILLHEAAHIQRGDHRVVLLEELVAALYWPIVSVHALNRELQRAREELCDNVVLASRDAISYGETLLHMAELLVATRPLNAAVGIFGRPGELERRIAALVDPGRSTTTTVSRFAKLAVALMFVVGLAIAATTRLGSTANAAEPTEPATAEKTPASSSETTAAAPAPAATDANRELNDPQQAGRFQGRVAAPDGNPLKGARIFIAPDKPTVANIGPARTETDADGRFAFDAPDMTYTELDGLPARRQGQLIVTADGYGPDWFHTWGHNYPRLHSHWDPVKGAALNLQLAADDVPIRGRLLDPSGQPLAGATVRITSLMIPRWRDLDRHLEVEEKPADFSTIDYERSLHQPNLVPGLKVETQTDADGRFTLTGIGRDRFAQLTISAPSVVNTTIKVMTRDSADVVVKYELGDQTAYVIHGANFTHQLEPGRTIQGRVVDAESGAPLPGMKVGPLVNAVTPFTTDLYPYVTDADGRFTITGQSPTWDDLTIVAVAADGLPYDTRWVRGGDGRKNADGDVELEIKCPRGIPYRLKLVDDEGRPVEAVVSYVDVHPNPHHPRVHNEVHWPINRIAPKADGVYEGFVLPGPGAVLIDAPGYAYRSAQVDPKAFFAPGQTNWTEEEQKSDYGTLETLAVSTGRYRDTLYRGSTVDQRDYEAIVLVNPPPDSGPLELTATVERDRPRQVHLVDPDGQPVVGASMSFHDWYAEELRAASFPLTRLPADRVRRIVFKHKDRQLIGYLEARGDGDAPYTVRMEPWATVIGRFVDPQGQPLPIYKPISDHKQPPKLYADMADDADRDHRLYVDADGEGRFRIEQLIPGRTYSAHVYPAPFGQGHIAFENQVLGPGEVRDLGDIPTTLSYAPEYARPTHEDHAALANIPDEAWGEPVNGLRVAIVLKSPPVDEHDRLRYDIVAENISDRELRFSAANAYESTYCKLRLVDAAGREAIRQHGALVDVKSSPNFDRHSLQPHERAVISPCGTKLVRLDEAGQPLPSSKPDEHFHFIQVKPGRYAISADVELGAGVVFDDQTKTKHAVEFVAPGEWTGRLQTGVVQASLFLPDGE